MFEELTNESSGPLTGYTVIEIAGIGPAPFACMILADLGATVIRVDRASAVSSNTDDGADTVNMAKSDVLNRNKYSIGVDLKSPKGIQVVLRLVESADVLIEGFRPNVAEKLGIGPEDCSKVNKKLVYGRMTGWGQTGPMSNVAGHDINYIALSGVLSAIGRKDEPPVPPLNLVGDFGGGGMYLVVGVLAALLEAQRSGRGQVVDAAMVDGAAILASMIFGMKASGFWTENKGENLIDTGAHFYEVYETKDGKYISIGAIEPQFYAEFLRLGEIEDPDFNRQWDRQNWPNLKEKLKQIVLTKTQQEWMDRFEGSDACVAPVLTMEEARFHEHNQSRNTFIEVDGVLQPAPGPRFSKNTLKTPHPPVMPGAHSRQVLQCLNYSSDEIKDLFENQAVK
jgi:alpha-methylacyl-CoA racemase